MGKVYTDEMRVADYHEYYMKRFNKKEKMMRTRNRRQLKAPNVNTLIKCSIKGLRTLSLNTIRDVS